MGCFFFVKRLKRPFYSLAERSDFKVLIIEAGDYHGSNPLVDVPGNSGLSSS